MKRKQAKKRISMLLSVVLAAVLLLTAFTVILSRASGGEPNLMGYQIKSVLSGSMEPSIRTGSVIAVKAGRDMGQLKEGDVITFKQPNSAEGVLITHRIIEAVRLDGGQALYRTKGDNNKEPDAEEVLSDNVLAVYTGFTVPYMGYFIDFSRSRAGAAMLLILPGLLLLGYSVASIGKSMSRLEKAARKIPAEPQTGSFHG